jgi:hypothetical protein
MLIELVANDGLDVKMIFPILDYPYEWLSYPSSVLLTSSKILLLIELVANGGLDLIYGLYLWIDAIEDRIPI